MPGLVQVAAVEPEGLLLGRLPHVALFALPWPRVFRGVRAEAPYLAHLVGDLLGDEVGGPAVHRPIARRVDDEVGRQFGAVIEHDGVLGQVVDLPLREFHVAVGDQVCDAPTSM